MLCVDSSRLFMSGLSLCDLCLRYSILGLQFSNKYLLYLLNYFYTLNVIHSLLHQSLTQFSNNNHADLPASYLFQPVALETLDPINDSAVDFLSELKSRIGTASGEIRERQFLFQRLCVTIQITIQGPILGGANYCTVA